MTRIQHASQTLYLTQCQRVIAAWFLVVDWWDRWRGRKRYGLIWGGEGVRWHLNVKKGMYPSYSSLSLSLPFAFLLCHFSKILAGARPIACGYLFMCNLSAGWPLPPFPKKAIYNSIQVYLPHSQCSTIIHPGPCFSTWFHQVFQHLCWGYSEKVRHYYTFWMVYDGVRGGAGLMWWGKKATEKVVVTEKQTSHILKSAEHGIKNKL